MKKSIKLLSLSLLLSAAMTSCYTTKYSVGEGAQTGVEVKGKNHFFLFGLIPGKASDPQAMANGAKDFEVTQVLAALSEKTGAKRPATKKLKDKILDIVISDKRVYYNYRIFCYY